jgi:putative effector of murein hydrolase
LHHRWRWIPPIVAACLPIVAVLLLAREPYVDYNRGGSFLTWWLGPATVALAAPMYRHGMALRSSLPKLVLIVLAGSVVGMATAGLTAWLLGAPLPVVMSTVPKSVTTPIAIEVCKELKGIPQITIALVILAGVLGASFGPPFLRLSAARRTALGPRAWCGNRRCRLRYRRGQWLRRGCLLPCWRCW